MVEDLGEPPEAADAVVARQLAKETGISKSQASELVAMLGPHNWSSLVREARILTKKL